MAKTTITANELTLNAWGKVEFANGSTEGVQIPATNADFKRVILVNNTGTGNGTVTVKAGNGIQGVNDGETYSVASGGFAAIRLDDGRFKNVSGDDKDFVVVTTSAGTVKVAVIELP